MARIRTIKPELFDDEVLATLPFECRLAFIGLWTEADREGRLKDRPTRLKARLFPYDEALDMNDVLAQLAAAIDPETGGPAFIQRYVVAGVALIQVINFVDHQRPHPKEPASTLPAYPAASREKTRPVTEASSCEPEPSSREETRQAVKRHGEPGSMNVHSGRTTMHAGKVTADPVDLGREGDLGEGEGDLGKAAPAPIGHLLTNGQLRHPAGHLISLWNSDVATVHGLVAVSDHPASMHRIYDALRRVPSLDDWSACLKRVGESDYLTGRVDGRNGRKFRADFWWVLTHYDEICAARYANDTDGTTSPPAVAAVNGHDRAPAPTVADSKAFLERMRHGGELHG